MYMNYNNVYIQSLVVESKEERVEEEIQTLKQANVALLERNAQVNWILI